MSSYIPHTDQDIQQMLHALGLSSLDDLVDFLPDDVRLNRPLHLPDGLNETELSKALRILASKNRALSDTGPHEGALTGFLGAGVYDHTIPAAVEELSARQEFFTSYTPYQPEISQGTLQALFEYQTMFCALTGLDISNASLYDGANACVEACRMVLSPNGRNRILVSDSVHPHILETLDTLLPPAGFKVTRIPLHDSVTDTAALHLQLDKTVAGVVIQSPNRFGFIEDITSLSAAAHNAGALLIQQVMDALSLCVLKTPGESGADIAAGSGQVFGGGLSFGGPYFGFLAACSTFLRRLPGRIVGQTVDADGQQAFVLTLQTREQHIRRDKATSNVCTNHSLYAVRAAIYLALTGPEGLREIAADSMMKARLLETTLLDSGLFEKQSQHPYFREFTLRCRTHVQQLYAALLEDGILIGYPLDDAIVFCATEKTPVDDIDRLGNALRLYSEKLEADRI